MNSDSGTELATLGGGCFWCVEGALLQLAGVESVVSGYAGGTMPDPAVIDYRTLLLAFFAVHDPTTRDRQGNDIGSQYRSVIFTHGAEQEKIARNLIAELDTAKTWPSPIVTDVLPAPRFWPAEDYHQNYFAKNPHQGYCMAVVAPKATKLRKVFAGRLKAG